eukprot:TRINITY_DN2394_c0_g1_i1.p1 TRINITY_DN2394_c0_g1~~TRINITY_DN2394_c0_g1_i1.p1  ORF type:complete len:1209 (-),score=157.83 TRINITY_DN2394_c0_g1_i1:86-3343(-)
MNVVTEQGAEFDFDIGVVTYIDETLNVPDFVDNGYCGNAEYWPAYNEQWSIDLPCCPYPTEEGNPCSDKISTDPVSDSEELQVGNVNYKLDIVGFTPDLQSAPTIGGAVFVSQELKATEQILLGRLIVSCAAGASSACNDALDEFRQQCSLGTCENGVCVYTPQNLGSTCDDGDVCTAGSKCQAGSTGEGACVGTQQPAGTSCDAGSEAPDLGECSEYQCSGNGQCVPVAKANGASCNGDGSTIDSECQEWQCRSGQCRITDLSQSCSNAPGSGNSCQREYCVSGSCQWTTDPSRERKDCTDSSQSGSQCAPLKCVSGTCIPDVNSAPTAENACQHEDHGDDDFCRYTKCRQGDCLIYNYNKAVAQCQGSTICNYTKCSAGICKTLPRGSKIGGRCDDDYVPPQEDQRGVGSYGVCRNPLCQSDGTCGLSIDTSNSGDCPTPSPCYRRGCSSTGECIEIGDRNNKNGCPSLVEPQCEYYSCDSNFECKLNIRVGQACSGSTSNQCTPSKCVQGSDGRGKCEQYNANAGTVCSAQYLVSGNADECNLPRCNSNGQCVIDFAPSTVHCTGDLSDIIECEEYRCDGAGECTPQAAVNKPCETAEIVSACEQRSCNEQKICEVRNIDYIPCSNPQRGQPECQSAQCLGGECAYRNDDSVPCSDGNECTDDSCSDGACVSVADPTNTCSTDFGECNVPICDAEGNCIPEPANDGVVCEQNSNPCDVKTCQNGDCVAVSQQDKICLENECNIHRCDGTTCVEKEFINLNKPCGQVSSVLCSQTICHDDGTCGEPANYWDEAVCDYQDGFDKCVSYLCENGECNQNQPVNVEDGTPCKGGELQECKELQCISGSCTQVISNGAYCYEPASKYRDIPSLRECEAFACQGGACSPLDIVPVTGANCSNEYVHECLIGWCYDGFCNPAYIDDIYEEDEEDEEYEQCDPCRNYDDCASCVVATPPAGNSSLTTLTCLWCDGNCFDSKLIDEVNEYISVDVLKLQCISECPVPPEEDGGDDNTLAIALGVSIPALTLLTIFVVAGAIIGVIIKMRMSATAVDTNIGGFEDGRVIEGNPLHEKESKVAHSALHYADNT